MSNPPPAPPDTADREAVQALVRGLAVMRALGTRPAGATIAETAQATGITRAGARRILLTLAALGYARQDGRRFALTPRVLEIAGGLLAGGPLPVAADPVARALCERLECAVSVGLLEGPDVVYLLRHDPPRPIRLGIQAGFRLPAHASSMGWVLLAGLPPWQVEFQLRRSHLARLTERTETDPERLLAGIESVRRAGWSFLDSAAEDGVAGLSVPIRDAGGRPTAALNLSVRSVRFPPDRAEAELLPVLRAAAADIEGRMGHAVPPNRPTPPRPTPPA
ncbi:IclR family transcriptional regulator [Stella humosa]|uniref:IclR family transcriptional regulator n=1 Tax=Stella humosa TaxID=94 RepID=A0A3N1MC59_9PROT|nr:IclR family transcriptional regulator C-terminal domain-containing protein [Stella humosa]ROQ00297.1 IclR family transcriptional regulator [Stella humosa]BBK30465.1 IclR family transcriptional regulator [Stella humosa]